MIERPDAFEIGAALAFLGVAILCLAPVIERVEAVFAFFELIERGMR